MLDMQQELAASDELFGVVERRIRLDDQRRVPATSMLRLKQAIAMAADAEVCLSALEDLRAAMGRSVASCHDLRQRCRDLEDALQSTHGHMHGAETGVTLPADSPARRETMALRRSFGERLAHVFGTHAKPPSMALLRVGIGASEQLDLVRGSTASREILQIASARMAHAVRSGDLVTQIDIEEFACVLLDVPSREQLTHLACKLLDLLSEPVQVSEREVSLQPNIGIATCPEDGTTPDALLRSAGAAMRRAAHQGSGYAFSDARAEAWASQFSHL
jgi:diguanylate cyclase (GGDEF)-like protein